MPKLENLRRIAMYVAIALLLVGVGRMLFGHAGPNAAPAAEVRRVLYYVDPMNPAHTSQNPGKAPCGMDMVAVYSDQHSAFVREAATIPSLRGMVQVSPAKQQIIGIKTALVEQRRAGRILRLLGKVAVDETRLYHVSAPVNGWITEAHPFATGDRVKKNQVLATYYSPQLATTAQSLLYAVNTRGRLQRNRQDGEVENVDKIQENLHLQQFIDSLKNLGMGDAQITAMITNRKQAANIEILAPADGHILTRNLSLGLRFERGTEFYQIADLSHLWILAEVLEDEAEHLVPGLQVTVTVPSLRRKWVATVSSALPKFDATARRLQVRLELENPGLALKPDMFVDLEAQVSLPESITIPADCVLNSGLQKTVFVDAGTGAFEPRAIEVAARQGDYICVASGLKPGERIVISGAFLLDSESRMKLAARNMGGPEAAALASSSSEQLGMVSQEPQSASPELSDPVCGMGIQEKTEQLESHIEGITYHFCSAHCKKRFDENPAGFLSKARASSSALAAKQSAQ